MSKVPTSGEAFARFIGVQPKPGSVAAKAAARLAGTDGKRFAETIGALPPKPRPGAGRRFAESLKDGR